MMKSFESSIQSYFIRSLGMSQIQQILQCARKKNTIRLNNPHSSHAKRQIKIEIPDLFANKRVRKTFARSRRLGNPITFSLVESEEKRNKRD